MRVRVLLQRSPARRREELGHALPEIIERELVGSRTAAGRHPLLERAVDLAGAIEAGFLQIGGRVSTEVAEERGMQRVERLARDRHERTRAQIDWFGHDSVFASLARRRSSASSIVSTPRLRAFSNLLPAFSPTTTKDVFFETLSLTLPPFASTTALASSRDNVGRVPVITTVFPLKAVPVAAARGSSMVSPRA